ncbi:hypothetical protein AXF42_Ash003508 [Apostasia shenzhenica]|uniref:Uncharacterized protein n=1 Tax=Apostasia shenzhenica TaxID=1088818 RepID=A0A2I0BGE2_9ASPA|nr:hypothetical protein AXF42_Ash003508 [Apostasia shenzhenica]
MKKILKHVNPLKFVNPQLYQRLSSISLNIRRIFFWMELSIRRMTEHKSKIRVYQFYRVHGRKLLPNPTLAEGYRRGRPSPTHALAAAGNDLRRLTFASVSLPAACTNSLPASDVSLRRRRARRSHLRHYPNDAHGATKSWNRRGKDNQLDLLTQINTA